MRALDILEHLSGIIQLEKWSENNWKDCTIGGECSNCGNCCGNFLPVSEKEIRTIHRYMKKHHIKEQIHRYPIAAPIADYTCPFRSDTEKKCLIYEVRPMICRDFRCDKPKQTIYADRDLYQDKYGVCDMRGEFFGRKML